LKCPCDNCLIVGRCRRILPDHVVKKCDLVCQYLKMNPGRLKSISFIDTNLEKGELTRRFSRIVECLGLKENGGRYIGSEHLREEG